MILGIDGGLNGGLTVLNDDGTIYDSIPMPVIKGKGGSTYDIKYIYCYLEDFPIELAIWRKLIQCH